MYVLKTDNMSCYIMIIGKNNCMSMPIGFINWLSFFGCNSLIASCESSDVGAGDGKLIFELLSSFKAPGNALSAAKGRKFS